MLLIGILSVAYRVHHGRVKLQIDTGELDPALIVEDRSLRWSVAVTAHRLRLHSLIIYLVFTFDAGFLERLPNWLEQHLLASVRRSVDLLPVRAHRVGHVDSFDRGAAVDLVREVGRGQPIVRQMHRRDVHHRILPGGIVAQRSVHVENAVLQGIVNPSRCAVGGTWVLVQSAESSSRLRGLIQVLPAHPLLAILITDLLELVVGVPVCLALQPHLSGFHLLHHALFQISNLLLQLADLIVRFVR